NSGNERAHETFERAIRRSHAQGPQAAVVTILASSWASQRWPDAAHILTHARSYASPQCTEHLSFRAVRSPPAERVAHRCGHAGAVPGARTASAALTPLHASQKPWGTQICGTCGAHGPAPAALCPEDGRAGV